MSLIESTSKFFKNIGSSIIRYFQLTPRLWKLIGLESFIFASFIGICAIISEGIMRLPNPTEPSGLVFLYAALKVGLSFLLVAIWLGIWFLLTKLLMKNDEKNKQENEEASD